MKATSESAVIVVLLDRAPPVLGTIVPVGFGPEPEVVPLLPVVLFMMPVPLTPYTGTVMLNCPHT